MVKVLSPELPFNVKPLMLGLPYDVKVRASRLVCLMYPRIHFAVARCFLLGPELYLLRKEIVNAKSGCAAVIRYIRLPTKN